MRTYKVIKTTTSEFTIEAESEEEAIEKTEGESPQCEEQVDFEVIDITLPEESESGENEEE